jgi:multisubunit Na+/H+ antiporter MnhE subunit
MFGRTLVRWGAMLGLWLGIAGTAEHQELVAGLVCGLVAAIAGAAGLLRAGYAALPDARWMARIRRPLATALPDGARLVGALATRRRGEVRDVPLPGIGGGRLSAGRQAFAAVAGSLAPNTLVVETRPGERALRVHELVPRPGEEPL